MGDWINGEERSEVQVTCFTELCDEACFHFQIIKLHKQIYAWIGCNSAKIGSLYAAAAAEKNNTVSIANILGGTSDNPGPAIARRILLRTSLNVVLACNIPNNSPMLEAAAEKKLIQKLITLGYTNPKSGKSPSS